MPTQEELDRQALEDRLLALEAELEQALKQGASESHCENLRGQIVSARAAFNRGCN